MAKSSQRELQLLKLNSARQTRKHEFEELRRVYGQLETVQVHVLGLRWRSRLKTQTGDDRERSAAGGSEYELSFACQRPASLHTVVLHVCLALGGSAQRLLEHAGNGEGLLSWRRLVAEYAPADSWQGDISVARGSCPDLQMRRARFVGRVRGEDPTIRTNL